MHSGRGLAELILAAALTLVGIVLTAYGAVAHAGWTSAPGATATLVGGGWLGNVLARRDVPLFGQHATGPEGSEA
jgi:hypothetical protein